MTRYYRYRIHNIEPLRIADDSHSQGGQVLSLRYIPGSSIRGYVVNRLAKEAAFESYKKILLSSSVRFQNAYLSSADGKVSYIPSLKGFYEDKKEVREGEKKEIENVVIHGTFEEGHKRAALGRYCRPNGDALEYCSVDTSADLKILIGRDDGSDNGQKVFRNEYMLADNYFTGYIAVDDPAVQEQIGAVMQEQGQMVLGNARSQGLGKCRIVECGYMDEGQIPYEEYAQDTDCTDPLDSAVYDDCRGYSYCYMALLSHTVMRDENGEFCGLNCDALAEKMGVEDLRIEYCSTSTVDVRGYNRSWGVKIPTVPMYEQGSVFKLIFRGTLTREKMRDIMRSGIGVRRNEGFGQVIFLKDYEHINKKYVCKDPKGNSAEKPDAHRTEVKTHAEDDQVIRIAAKNYYRRLIEQYIQESVLSDMNIGDIANSRIGTVYSLLQNYQYDYAAAVKVLKDYFKHEDEKEENSKVQKERASLGNLKEKVMKVLNSSWEDMIRKTCRGNLSEKESGDCPVREQIMGIPLDELLSEEELGRRKIQYLIQRIRYNNR